MVRLRFAILAAAIAAVGASGGAKAAPAEQQRAVDASALPGSGDPSVVRGPTPGKPERAKGRRMVGWAHSLLEPPFVDHRRRAPRSARPIHSGSSLHLGESFRFDLTFGGNPAGLAEATVVALETDPRGGPPAGAPIVRIEGHARTSGIVSLLATVTDDIVSRVDAQSGATISSVSDIRFSGWTAGKYKHRVAEQHYDGRGYVHLKDTKDGKSKEKTRRVPVDTFDPLAGMAWVRALPLERGDEVRAHIIDGTTLLRVELVSLGTVEIPQMPSVGIAMGIDPKTTLGIKGTLTRVDRYGQPIPGKRVYEMRAWLSGDERRIPLAIESDMWVGALRLALTGYDPPRRRAEPSRTRDTSEDPGPSDEET